MIFTQQKDEWYPDGFWVSDLGMFSIGFTKELFNRKKLQVMHKGGESWYVIHEYVTYESILLNGLLIKIRESLKILPESVSTWKDVDELLPKFSTKYLEDVGNEKFHKEANWSRKTYIEMDVGDSSRLSTDSTNILSLKSSLWSKLKSNNVDNFGSQ